MTRKSILIGWYFSCFLLSTTSCHPSIEHPVQEYVSLTPQNELPRILSTSDVKVVETGNNVTFECDVIRLGLYSVIWQKDDTILWIQQGNTDKPPIQYVTKNNRIRRNGTSLVLLQVEMEDEGDYSCEVSSNPNEKIGYRLTVLVPPSAVALDGIDFIQGNEGETIQMECQVSGNPMPRLSWEKIETNNVQDMNEKSSLLSIMNVTSSDAGSYACVAENGVGEPAKALIELNIYYKPKVFAPKEVIHSGIGYKIQLPCVVDASPFPRVDWFKDEIPVNPMRMLKGIEKGKRFLLHIDNVSKDDFGIYECVASNVLGNSSAHVELTGKPETPKITQAPPGDTGGKHSLTWEVESYVPITHYLLYLKNHSESLNSGSKWKQITIPSKSTSSMYHTQEYELPEDSRLLVKVVAVNEFGVSQFSNQIKVKSAQNDVHIFREGSPVKDSSLESASDHVSSNEDVETFEGNETNSSIEVFDENGEEDGHDPDSSDGQNDSNVSPTISPDQRRTQMVSIVTAVSLSCFFSYFAMRL